MPPRRCFSAYLMAACAPELCPTTTVVSSHPSLSRMKGSQADSRATTGSGMFSRAHSTPASPSLPCSQAYQLPWNTSPPPFPGTITTRIVLRNQSDFATINRSVPQMPTGMEKEEETEHHLQRALSAQQVYGTSEALVIPIPEIDHIERYDKLYKDDFKIQKQYVHMQAFNMDQEIPDYDMDSDDEVFLTEQSKKMELKALKFEEMMDRLEKGSGQQVVTLQEAKALLKEDDDLIIAVYDYWLNKRLKMQHPLILSVKTEKRDGSTTNNPYVAFRRRTEKMQTRKNRKNDEVSYEKMLKLRRDISRALTLIEMIKRREKTKKEMLQLTIEVLETRYQMEDFNGTFLAEAEELRHSMKPATIPTLPVADWGRRTAPVKKKREYKKRKSKANQQQPPLPPVCPYGEIDIIHPDVFSSDEDGLSPGVSTSDHEDENDPDGIFAFRRKKNCSYHAPLLGRPGNWPWHGSEEGGLGEKKYRYSLASLPQPHRCAGFVRRRVGRGGRVICDRASTEWDDGLHRLNFTDNASQKGVLGDYLVYIRERKIPHYRWRSPPPDDPVSLASLSPSTPLATEFNMESFRSHQEQLMEMQRDQLEQMLRQETSALDATPFPALDHSFSSQPTSRFTLDSASARFAASAVISSTAQLNTPTPPPASVASTTVHNTPTTTSNGPLNDGQASGLSTLPAAPVLRLNFPLNSVVTSRTATDTNSIIKVNSAASSPIDPLPKQNHEDGVSVNNVATDRVVAMDVT